MKSTKLLNVVALLSATCALEGQQINAFQNLDFESPVRPFVPDDPLPYNRIPLAQLMPHWTAYVGENVLNIGAYNNFFLSSAGVSLFGLEGQVADSVIFGGEYSAFLRTGHDLDFSTGTASTSLAQIGWVEFDTKSIQMKVRSLGPFSVFMDGQPVDMAVMEQFPNYNLYAGDVSAFAGREAELRITSDLYFGPEIGGYSHMYLDDIVFSAVPIPEPATWMLLSLAGLAAIGMMRRRR